MPIVRLENDINCSWVNADASQEQTTTPDSSTVSFNEQMYNNLKQITSQTVSHTDFGSQTLLEGLDRPSTLYVHNVVMFAVIARAYPEQTSRFIENSKTFIVRITVGNESYAQRFLLKDWFLFDCRISNNSSSSKKLIVDNMHEYDVLQLLLLGKKA